MTNQQKPENSLINLFVNVIVPVLILNKLSDRLGAGLTLAVALSLPIGYGLMDLVRRKKTNFLSVLGILNISITGGLAILQLDGIWFAVKEAAFPFLIGVFVTASAFTRKPFIETLLMNPQILHLDLIETKLTETHRHEEFHQHLKLCTHYLSLSFYFSAAVNFLLAVRIFQPIDVAVVGEGRSAILNQQIASMTAWGAGILILPSMIILSLILWYLLHGIRRTTGLRLEEILKA
jgi:hypothetical protein